MESAEDFREIEKIKQLKARYFRLLDTKDWAAWRKVFTDDVVVCVDHTVSTREAEGSGPPLPEGADAFVAHIRGFLADVSTVHHGHMPEIDLTGPDTATGVWAMEDKVRFPDGRELHGYGHYHEAYRKVGGAWRIARLRLKRLRLDHTAARP